MKPNAYIIFTKIPEAGFVKTRLMPDYSDQEAATLQQRMLVQLINISEQIDDDCQVFLIYYAQDHATEKQFLAQLPEQIKVFSQTGETIGSKMSIAIQKVQKLGFQKVVLTGSDIPQLNGEIIKHAFEQLESSQLVIGPSLDGGYYLFGTNKLDPEPYLTADISWSTSSVYDSTLDLIKGSGVKFAVAKTLVDVDYSKDFDQVKEYLEAE